MDRRRLRFTLAFCAVFVVAVAAAFVLPSILSGDRDEEEGAAEGVPPALARHIEDLKKAIPGSGGESGEGPGGAGAFELAIRAYPDSDIPLARIQAANAAFQAVKGRGFPSGKDRPGTWVSIGPSEAVYPFFGPRDSGLYVPNEYSAASRINAMAIAPTCAPKHCTLWVAPAGGGVWRTDDALANSVKWTYLSGGFGINAIGSITVDPNDASGNTLYVGTGEANTCGSGCVHGVGIFKSTDGGDTWSAPIGQSAFAGRGVGSIAIKPGAPGTIYAASTFALHGMSSSCCSGITRITIPGAAMWGLYKSTDGGATWTYIHGGSANAADCATADPALVATNTTPCTPRGMRVVALDPSNSDIVYASSYARGVWRSNDAGATWTQIKASLNSAITTTLPWIAVTTLANGKTRMYVSEGHTGARLTPGGPIQHSRLFRSDDVAIGSPTFNDLTSPNPADPGWASFNFCTGQCWYDNVVYTPAGHPDTVYLMGSYLYGEATANKRGVLLSTDAGASFTDQTFDATDPVHPNGIHPDQHAIVVNPANQFQFFQGSDGGVVRSSGAFADRSSWCDSRGLSPTRTARCRQMLSRIPTLLEGMNKGLTSLQFQSLSVSPFDVNIVQGGTQDNGTWQTTGSPNKWFNMMVGDGGQSGFDATDPHFRFHTFFEASPDVNFSDGAIADWNWIADPIFETEPQEFYVPIISDPVVSRTLFVGTAHVWRTKTHGLGTMTLAELRQHCNEWTGDFPPTVQCGDWQPLGDPSVNGRLTAAAYGDRAGGDVAAVERTSSNTSTLWAATSTGRVFISRNADADPASAVTFTRLDALAANDPNRYVTGIFVDAANANHAWISYSGFSAATPTTPGHVFSVTYNPVAGTATWTSLDGSGASALGDIPVTDVVSDSGNGDLYTSSDYGVMRLASGSSTWTLAAPGMPKAEVAGLTIVASSRKLFAATHGLAAWLLNLP